MRLRTMQKPTIGRFFSPAGRWNPIFASPRQNAEDASGEKEMWSLIFEKVYLFIV